MNALLKKKIYYRRTDTGFEFPCLDPKKLDILTEAEVQEWDVDDESPDNPWRYPCRRTKEEGFAVPNVWEEITYDTDDPDATPGLTDNLSEVWLLADALTIEGAIIRHCGKTIHDDWTPYKPSQLDNPEDADGCEAFCAALEYACGPISAAKQRKELMSK